MKRRWPFYAGAGLLLLVPLGLWNCVAARRAAISVATPTYEAPAAPTPIGEDAPKGVTLNPVLQGLVSPTDVAFVPGHPGLAVVLEKEGDAKLCELSDGGCAPFFSREVLTASEEGLLGIAFHPKFEENGRFFIHYVAERKGKDTSVVEELRVDPSVRGQKPSPVKVIYEVVQPYQNHNAGQLAFGPDGFLYVGYGDGGYANDPHGHGQDGKTALGSMLRIDVDGEEGGKPYRIPADNPFLGNPDFLPETWAYGLRNPWRYTFDPKGRLIVADVGQNAFEEVDLVEKGANLGWNVREGRHCFEPKKDCKVEGLVDPIHEYGREQGTSISGGQVYLGKKLPQLSGKYVFGDFTSGRIWALPLPETFDPSAPLIPSEPLGKWSMLPVTFARDHEGELYVADFASGTLFRFDPK